ncbi:MAG: MBL fold metallo-hydrolase [Gammaproteobacteria bacterium]|nr:MBL fold metallo-hydrolase [Gammaproteobacteria bacterium]
MKTDTPHQIHALELGPMENFVYLLHDKASDRAAIVDPAWEVEEVIALAKANDITITDILLTHSHHDHVNGVERVLNQYDAQIHLLKEEAKFWGAQLEKPTLHRGGDIIKIGESEISVLHTPGHTPGSACYHMGDHLIAGDTLFVFGCGRCDMAGGDPEQMFNSLKHLRSDLPSHTMLHPGHNYAPTDPTSTMAAQKLGNPFLHFDEKQDFVKYRMQVHDKIRDIPYTPVSREEALASIKDQP